ncbi:hypothetical protein WI41_22505 [Burkholderia latens]|uniref:Uncharacterized protein n=1 Tax=Burkholderia latens TaxID=488446 RepID=A0AAP1C1R7_9BURK|nr:MULTISPECIES: hypothetical protein [Burkholderia]AOK07837.1 hypothetical protein WK25_25610 [Burkholderia latens]KVA04843.1 hypothetical protein WI41_22505 [Burkholderia latens]MBY4692923.1 hypothetical protein [Burkholderia latens]MCA8307622.1 hypothetical protein [Burkholderia sp. AU28942]QTO50642.1 hypothetical protein J8I86_24260 [Burkholderia latens]
MILAGCEYWWKSRSTRIDIVDDEAGSHPRRTISIEPYLNAGMAGDVIARHAREVVSMSIEQLARLRPFDRAAGSRARHTR